ncbi:MAG: hypothetical protein IPH84_18885 [Bacteroidales bacterium]|nr:hypothetical protein [Bacteroidales bacterium]
MLTKNRLDKSFGPVGATAGSVLVVAGLILLLSSWFGLLLLILGAFVGFSSTGTLIDAEKHRIRFSNYIFGFIPIGKWLSFDSSMKLGVKESRVVWSAFSAGNRQLDTQQHDFRIALYDAEQHEIFEINKYKTLESAKAGLQSYETITGLAHV